ncbi:MAG: IS5 family transposase [archaeon]
MNALYEIRVSGFYKLCLQVFEEIRFPFCFSNFSKKMYGNFVHTFLLVYKERLNVSYRRFVEIVEDLNLKRMLCIKRIPHFTTIQKFMQRINKNVFEAMVRACRKLLNLKDVEASIDGTGFSNTNPSHYYVKRSKEQDKEIKVKNYTKTMFLADNKSKLILSVKTFSDKTAETSQFKEMVQEVHDILKTILADKGFDSMSNRKHCWQQNIEVHIPFRKWKIQQDRQGKQHYSAKRRRALKLFNKTKYNYRVLIESINSSIKRTLGSYVCSKRADNQQKQVTIKAITYNIEQIGRTTKIRIFITC